MVSINKTAIVVVGQAQPDTNLYLKFLSSNA